LEKELVSIESTAQLNSACYAVHCRTVEAVQDTTEGEGYRAEKCSAMHRQSADRGRAQ
jgi:hypothetical protein